MAPEGKDPVQSEPGLIDSLAFVPVGQSVNSRGDSSAVLAEPRATTSQGGEVAPAAESVVGRENGSIRVTPSSTLSWAVEEDGILDLTSAQLHDLKDVELSVSLIELDLTANRLTKLDERIGQMTLLKKLSLRQNLYEDAAVESLTRWPALFGLQELVLRDNRLTKVPGTLEVFSCLTVLDMSFNKISSMKGISQVTEKLKELYLSNNGVVEIVEVDHLKELQILELGANRVRELNGIQNLTQLKELWLGKNRIKTVDLCGLTSLTRISLQNNRLTSMLGFQECVLLEELYLSNNFISVMEGLSTLTKLRILDASSNQLEAIQDIENLTKLEDLWLNDNRISSLDSLETVLQGVKGSLTTIYLVRNPCARNLEYIRILRAIMPKLIQIDSQFFD